MLHSVGYVRPSPNSTSSSFIARCLSTGPWASMFASEKQPQPYSCLGRQLTQNKMISLSSKRMLMTLVLILEVLEVMRWHLQLKIRIKPLVNSPRTAIVLFKPLSNPAAQDQRARTKAKMGPLQRVLPMNLLYWCGEDP